MTAHKSLQHNVHPDLEPMLTPLADLQRDERNAREHDERNLEAIASSYRRFGQQKPIVVDADGTILAGNGQYLAAQHLGWTHIAAIRADLTGAEATAYALADNQTGALAGWDADRLAELMGELREQDESLLTDAGFDDADIAALVVCRS